MIFRFSLFQAYATQVRLIRRFGFDGYDAWGRNRGARHVDVNGEKGPFLAVLPGSHTKVVRINAAGGILGCATTLSGEMISALSQNTILKDSLKVCNDFDPELLYRGYAYSTCYGLNKKPVFSGSFDGRAAWRG